MNTTHQNEKRITEKNKIIQKVEELTSIDEMYNDCPVESEYE